MCSWRPRKERRICEAHEVNESELCSGLRRRDAVNRLAVAEDSPELLRISCFRTNVPFYDIRPSRQGN